MDMRICLQILERGLPPMTEFATATVKGAQKTAPMSLEQFATQSKFCCEKSLRQAGGMA